MIVLAEIPQRIPRLLILGLAAMLLPPPLAGCSPVGAAVGVGAAAGLGATQERGLGQAIDDNLIWLAINRRWLAHDPTMFRRVDLQVQEGRVLLTGIVAKPEMRVDAVRLAWQADGVREVINEIRIAEPRDLAGYLQDSWLARRLELKILLDEQIRSINYSIDAVDNVIYLMGVAQSEAELQRVIDHARDIPYVRRVVSYVRLKADPARTS